MLRRLFEEMGLSCEQQIKTNFIYKTLFENGMTEHEYDYILIGTANRDPMINKDEVESYKWVTIADIKKDIVSNPNQYTSWFKIALEKVF